MPAGTADGLQQTLNDIATRLQSIESALQLRAYASPEDPSRRSQSPYDMEMDNYNSRVERDDFDQELDNKFDSRLGSSTPQTRAGERADRSNPLQEVNETIERVLGVDEDSSISKGRLATENSYYGDPDAIRRGLLNEAEVQGLFDFFFEQLHPWIMMLSLKDDTNAMEVRKRSPLLFHTILLLSTAYSPTPSNLHMTLSTYVNNILAPSILSPRPETLTMDFLAAVDLLNIHKPVRNVLPVGSEASEMLKTKVNGLASYILQGILARGAERLELSSVTNRFLRAHQLYIANGTPISTKVINDLRLYYWLLANDVHGNVQSGRRCNMILSPTTLATTRLFASLRLQPCDTRLSAAVELFEVSRPILKTDSFERTRRIGRSDLEKFNAGMEAWDSTWRPILTRELQVDPLAMSISCFGEFITITYNASAFTAAKGTTSGNDINDWEWDCLNRSVRAAEALIFRLSEESRVKGAWRAVQWEEAERVDGYRRLLPDESIIESHKYAMDAVTCIMYIFPLIFLVKLFNEGMLTASLVVLSAPTQQPNFLSPNKLPRLLELGSAYLDGVASNLYHPAKQQAVVVRALLEAGLRGRPPLAQLPRHASVVLSPAPDPVYTPLPSAETILKRNADWSPTNSANILNPLLSSSLNHETSRTFSGSDSSIREQRYQYQIQMNQLANGLSGSHHSHNSLGGENVGGGTLPNAALEAVLEGVDFSVFGETSAFWEYNFSNH